jgi:hypothetical protein
VTGARAHGRDAHAQRLARYRLRRGAWREEKGQRQSIKKKANAFRSADHLFPFCTPSAIIST